MPSADRRFARNATGAGQGSRPSRRRQRRLTSIVAVPGRSEGDVVELEPISVWVGERLIRGDGLPRTQNGSLGPATTRLGC